MEGVGIHDDLFDLGADSIQVFQIVARANDVGLNLTPKQILSGRTVAGICKELESGGGTAQRGESPRLAARTAGGPLSPPIHVHLGEGR